MNEASERPRERKTRETRERIFHEAVVLFEQRGFAGTKIRDIAERAGVSTVTVHNHFRTKDHLLHALGELYFERVISLVDELAELAARDGEVDAGEYVLLARRTVLGWPTTGRQLAADTQRVVLRTETGHRLYRELLSRFRALVENLRKNSTIRDDLETDAIAANVSDLALGALVTWSTDLSESQTPSQKAAELVGFLVATLRADSGATSRA